MSLRDVDRALIVFEFFIEKNDVIAPEMEQLAEEEGNKCIQV